jgi:hypothetical protein
LEDTLHEGTPLNPVIQANDERPPQCGEKNDTEQQPEVLGLKGLMPEQGDQPGEANDPDIFEDGLAPALKGPGIPGVNKSNIPRREMHFAEFMIDAVRIAPDRQDVRLTRIHSVLISIAVLAADPDLSGACQTLSGNVQPLVEGHPAPPRTAWTA